MFIVTRLLDIFLGLNFLIPEYGQQGRIANFFTVIDHLNVNRATSEMT